jgi:hypothetical protein
VLESKEDIKERIGRAAVDANPAAFSANLSAHV